MSWQHRWITCLKCGRKIAQLDVPLRSDVGPRPAYMGHQQPLVEFVAGAFEEELPDGKRVLVCPRGHRSTFVHRTR